MAQNKGRNPRFLSDYPYSRQASSPHLKWCPMATAVNWPMAKPGLVESKFFEGREPLGSGPPECLPWKNPSQAVLSSADYMKQKTRQALSRNHAVGS
jgi:hypothetical protein